MSLYAIKLEDGSVDIMDLMADHGIERELELHPPRLPVVDVLPITEDQAAAIRAARPKPEVQPSSAPVSGSNAAELAELKAQLAQMASELLVINNDRENMAAELDDFRQFKVGLAHAIAEKKAQEL